ncbi:MAG TPA: hypothetical protein VF787_05160 [Thermoanaerobaculia bacterium]
MIVSRLLAVLLALCVATVAAFGDTYIVPVWSKNVPSSEGAWTAQIVAQNLSDQPVEYRVTDAFPLSTAPCPLCEGTKSWKTIPPGATVEVTPGDALVREQMTIGAFVVETNGPLVFDAIAYRASLPEFRQHLDVARRWLTPGAHSITTVARGGPAWRINAFVVNPNSAEIIVHLWIGPRDENQVSVLVPPHTTRLITLRPPICNGLPCTQPDEYPPSRAVINVESQSTNLVGISSIDVGWAIFSLPGTAK